MVLRWLLRFVVVVVVVAAAALAWNVSGKGRGPKMDGELSFPGLTDRVEVLRDATGIPYLFAANTPDLIRAQGFVTAQGRLFQIEAYRAPASRRLAEAIGERGLASDREMRTLGLRLVGGIAVLLVLFGSLMGKVRRNFYLGIRTPWTLASERVSHATHRLAGRSMVVAGLAALVPVLAGAAVWTVAAALGTGLLLPVVFSLVHYKQLERRGQLETR
jgi:hypothetical protein